LRLRRGADHFIAAGLGPGVGSPVSIDSSHGGLLDQTSRGMRVRPGAPESARPPPPGQRQSTGCAVGSTRGGGWLHADSAWDRPEVCRGRGAFEQIAEQHQQITTAAVRNTRLPASLGLEAARKPVGRRSRDRRNSPAPPGVILSAPWRRKGPSARKEIRRPGPIHRVAEVSCVHGARQTRGTNGSGLAEMCGRCFRRSRSARGEPRDSQVFRPQQVSSLASSRSGRSCWPAGSLRNGSEQRPNLY